MNCPLCQKKVTPYPHHLLELYLCPSCNLIFQKQKHSASFFIMNNTNKSKGYYSSRESASDADESRSSQRLSNNNHYESNELKHNNLSWGKNDPRFTKNTYEMKKSTFRNFIQSFLIPYLSPSSHFLDIGTGSGAFLKTCREFGFLADGLEPDLHFAPLNKRGGHQIITKPLETVDLLKKYYDCVTLFDVLEHFKDPIKAIRKIKTTLKENGLLIISTPSLGSISYKLLKSKWPHFKKEHLFYFSPESLKKMLEENGYTIIKTANFKKALTLQYFQGYFTAFPHFLFSPVFSSLLPLLPKKITSTPFFISNGNILVVARRI